MRTLIVFLAVLVVSASVAALQTAASDVSGTWTGKFTMPKDAPQGGANDSAYIVLKQTGTTVTGTAGPRADRQQDIDKGKVTTTKDGTTVTFESGRTGHVIYFELKLVDGKLKGTAKDEFYKNTLTVELEKGK